jgi:hypothetical protein
VHQGIGVAREVELVDLIQLRFKRAINGGLPCNAPQIAVAMAPMVSVSPPRLAQRMAQRFGSVPASSTIAIAPGRIQWCWFPRQSADKPARWRTRPLASRTVRSASSIRSASEALKVVVFLSCA